MLMCLLQAALLLGLRATRRPAGYWESLEVMDAELDTFVAGEGMSTLAAVNCIAVETSSNTGGLVLLAVP
jgi:hypothetical protein